MSCEKDRTLKSGIGNTMIHKLSEEHFRTSKLLRAYNKLTNDEKEQCFRSLKDLLGAVGDGTWIEPPFYIEFGENTFLGKQVFINYMCIILDVCRVTVGDFILFGPSVRVFTTTTPLSTTERSASVSCGKPVNVGSDVWVGGRAIICPGVTIGDGSVVGAGTVVTEDIPPYSLVVGNPCKIIKSITDENCPMLVRSDEGTEREKMLRGELYSAFVPELIAERKRSFKLARTFNGTNEDEQDKREGIVRELFGQVGENTRVDPPFYCEYGSNTTLGRNVYVHSGCFILDVCSVTIGDNVILGHSVHVYSATHPISASVRRSGLEYGKPITIGSDVWIDNGSILCPGVNIGNGSVIGAGSVVTKDIPSGVLAVGNPCRVAKELHTECQT